MSRRDVTTNRKHERSIDRADEPGHLEESRDLELNENHKRAVMNMSYADPLHVPSEIIPHGWEYRWVRESCLDKPDNKRMVDAKRKGWTPVPSNRHPDMVYEDFFGRLEHMKPYIYHAGLILCERPAELGRLEQKRAEEHNYQVMTSMPGTDNFMGEPNIPVRNSSDIYMTKNAALNSK